MSGKVGAIFRPSAEKLHFPRLTMDWALPMNGRPDGLGVTDEWAFPSYGRSDEWKGRCNLPPAGAKLHLPHFTNELAFPFNGNANQMGTPLH